jgi:hypothetical protein
MNPPDNCSICTMYPSANDEDWFKGYIGIMGVTFCDVCFNGIIELITELLPPQERKEL